MSGRVVRISGCEAEWLAEAWELAAGAAGSVREPGKALHALEWKPSVVPATAAASLRRAGAWSLDGPTRDFDADDWWFRTRFAAQPPAAGEQLWLCFDGLATIAEVWLNGVRILTTRPVLTRTIYAICRAGEEDHGAVRACLDALRTASARFESTMRPVG